MKIKVAMFVDGLYMTGITSVVKRYCKHIHKEQIVMTILAGKPIDALCKDEIEKYGVNVIILPSRHKETLKFYYLLYKSIKNNQFDIFHVHGNSVNSTVELFIAWMAGVRFRIFHSHNTVCNKPMVHKLLLPFFKIFCTNGFACGELAGDWIYGKGNFTVIPNGLEVEKFRFNEEKRRMVRKELGIENKLVIGHVGRVNDQKNQAYLIDIFVEVAKKMNEAVLFMVGEGPNLEQMKEKAAGLWCSDKIIFYGAANDTAAMYSAMDVFVFPSRYEGLPLVLLEAQISGLPCILSDVVTKEVDFGEMTWHSIKELPKEWVEDILAAPMPVLHRENYFKIHQTQIKKYDIRENAKDLAEQYKKIVGR